MTKKLTRYIMQCADCLDIIESKHQRDFVSCSCWYKTRCCGVEAVTSREYPSASWNCGQCGKYNPELTGLAIDGGPDELGRRACGSFDTAIDLSEYEEVTDG